MQGVTKTVRIFCAVFFRNNFTTSRNYSVNTSKVKKLDSHCVDTSKSDTFFIMTSNVLTDYASIIVGTGNILQNEEFKKAKNPTQEVRE